MWLPLILLLITLPFYIPLLAQCFPRNKICIKINGLFVDKPNELKTRTEWKEEIERLKKSAIENSNPPPNCPPYPPFKICSRLLIPQILLGFPVVSR